MRKQKLQRNIQIVELYTEKKKTMKEIAKKFGVSTQCVSLILNKIMGKENLSDFVKINSKIRVNKRFKELKKNKKVCQHCGKKFLPFKKHNGILYYKNNKKYCSIKCAGKSRIKYKNKEERRKAMLVNQKRWLDKIRKEDFVKYQIMLKRSRDYNCKRYKNDKEFRERKNKYSKNYREKMKKYSKKYYEKKRKI